MVEATTHIFHSRSKAMSTSVGVLKARHAVTVANGCARVLEDERAENSEQIRKLRWALRLERDAHQKKKDNPLGHPLLPTHAEIQERLAE